MDLTNIILRIGPMAIMQLVDKIDNAVKKNELQLGCT